MGKKKGKRVQILAAYSISLTRSKGKMGTVLLIFDPNVLSLAFLKFILKFYNYVSNTLSFDLRIWLLQSLSNTP